MKKSIFIAAVFLGVIVITSNAASKRVYAQSQEMVSEEIIDADKAQPSVTRENCLISILKCIGWQENSMSKSSDVATFVDMKYGDYSMFAKVSNIAYGEICWVPFGSTYLSSHMQTDWDYFFIPHRDATYAEAIAFMIRCLGEYGKDADLNFCWQKAIAYGLITEKDGFFTKTNENLNQNDFAILLERFKDQKRYRYCDYSNGTLFLTLIDDSQSVTYREFLEKSDKSYN